ncbi:MAG: ATP-dependent RecD-like DNA helicase [Verrucomicrobiae bacterium]|nr:ATP-dependent RecD-like DNA helicase [Verrucomicrobiae bacterium]
MPETIRGVLERIMFSNEENHFLIGDLRPEDKKATITVTGTMPGVQCGETLEVTGDWTINPKYGNQFKVSEVKSTLPSTVHGIRKYLGSGLVPGIGKHFANKIVDHFGAETLKIISEESARLREVPGIGAGRAKSIKAAWEEQKAIREVMLFLQTYGVSAARCVRLVKMYGNEAKTILQNEPYRVAREIDGIGFKTADQIALNLGFGNESPKRLDAGLLFSLEELETEGHTCVPRRMWVEHAAQLLGTSEANIEARISELIAQKEVVAVDGEHRIQLPNSHRAETTIAEVIRNCLKSASALPPIKVEAAIDWAQDKASFGFAEEQAQAIRTGLNEKVSIITGGPGTGKTTILRALVQILQAKKVDIVLAAPTGRAAQRMTEATGGYAQTIHRLLKFEPHKGRFAHNESNPLKAGFVIVDESSMLDARLAAALLRAIPQSAHLTLVGDVNQLPSVGAGNVLKDLIESGAVPVTRLQKIFRQHEESSIITTAYNVLNGAKNTPYLLESTAELGAQYDMQFIKAPEPEECLRVVEYLCTRFIPTQLRKDPLRDAQVLAPMHRGVAGISNLNTTLQKALNKNTRGFSFGAYKYCLGDKIIQNRNNYDLNIYNGDIGTIEEINGEDATLTVQFDSERVEMTRSDLLDVSLAYAISVHKSQGSEYPIVIIPLVKGHFMMLQRNLLYTALTRGKKKIFVVGDPVAWYMAVQNADPAKRFTDLKEKLLEA